MLLAARGAREFFVAQQVRPLDQQQEIIELLSRVGTHADVSVEGRLDGRRLECSLNGRDRWCTAEGVNKVRVVAAGDRHRRGRREIDVFTMTGMRGPPRGGADGNGGERGADPLADAATGLDGDLIGATAPDETTRLGLHDELGRRQIGQRATATVRRDGQHDEARKPVRVVVARGFGGRPRLDDDIRRAYQIDDARVVRCTDHRALAVREKAEQRPVFAAQFGLTAGPRAQRVAADRLDLDHVGAGISQ